MGYTFEPIDREFEDICQLVYRKSGLKFDSNKRGFVEHKVADRLRLLGHSSYAEYFQYLQRDQSETEIRILLDLLTTNETYFFRDMAQLKTFEIVARSILEAQTERKLRIWSSGCSIGCEPYSLVILLIESMKDVLPFDFEILGTDISMSALDVAHKGLYMEREIRELPQYILNKYFTHDGTYYVLSKKISSFVNFQYLNLMDRQLMSMQRGYNIIFCRNVLMYFDEDSRRIALEYLYDSLLPGGYIFLGRAESMNGASRAFRLIRVGNDLVYMK
ncbi:MAG: protein-glutamate O-methyltransferase CheR [Firmicutes bacterium]|nr:protein-glutamate O-methyltransferase CheR [Bacillota bacterium]